jgi:integrase
VLDTLKRLYSDQDKLREALLSANTRKGYHYDWRAFARWCTSMHLVDLPATPETVGLFVMAELLRKQKVSTVTRRVAVIVHEHKAAGLPSPASHSVHELLRGARRLRCERTRQVRPLALDELRQCSRLLALDGTPIALRDRAILVVGFASALRSASLAALAFEDAEFTDRGILLQIRREKQDQEGHGRMIGLPPGEHAETCPVKCLRAWLDVRGAWPGPLFHRLDSWGVRGNALQAERICQIVQAAVARIGLDPKIYGGHSLRAGFVTQAGECGVGELLIASQTGHHDMATLRRYFRRRDVFRSNASAMIGL